MVWNFTLQPFRRVETYNNGFANGWRNKNYVWRCTRVNELLYRFRLLVFITSPNTVFHSGWRSFSFVAFKSREIDDKLLNIRCAVVHGRKWKILCTICRQYERSRKLSSFKTDCGNSRDDVSRWNKWYFRK